MMERMEKMRDANEVVKMAGRGVKRNEGSMVVAISASQVMKRQDALL